MRVIAQYRRATQAAPNIHHQPQWLSVHNILVLALTEPNLIVALVKPMNSILWHQTGLTKDHFGILVIAIL